MVDDELARQLWEAFWGGDVPLPWADKANKDEWLAVARKARELLTPNPVKEATDGG